MKMQTSRADLERSALPGARVEVRPPHISVLIV
jgi:hypothetical protein